MKIPEFNRKYESMGGMSKLAELRSLFYSQDYIANHFGVTKERVRQWMRHYFGSEYDPRPDRRELVVSGMVDFARKHSIEDFHQAFKTKNKEYYQQALDECYKQEIYKKHVKKTK